PPQRRGSPSPAGRLPRRVASECRKALPQTPAPPLSGWPISSAGESGPFAPPALPGFIATADPSAPVPRIGTRRLTGLPLGDLPWHRGDRFPRSAQEPLAGLTPSSCRSPLGQSTGFLRASSQANNWSLVSATFQRFRHVINGSLAFVLAVSREDPKFLRVDDAEIVGDGRRELVEPLWHGFAQEAEHGFGKVAEFGVAFVVGDVLVHHFPQPFDRVEMRAV